MSLDKPIMLYASANTPKTNPSAGEKRKRKEAGEEPDERLYVRQWEGLGNEVQDQIYDRLEDPANAHLKTASGREANEWMLEQEFEIDGMLFTIAACPDFLGFKCQSAKWKKAMEEETNAFRPWAKGPSSSSAPSTTAGPSERPPPANQVSEYPRISLAIVGTRNPAAALPPSVMERRSVGYIEEATAITIVNGRDLLTLGSSSMVRLEAAKIAGIWFDARHIKLIHGILSTSETGPKTGFELASLVTVPVKPDLYDALLGDLRDREIPEIAADQSPRLPAWEDHWATFSLDRLPLLSMAGPLRHEEYEAFGQFSGDAKAALVEEVKLCLEEDKAAILATGCEWGGECTYGCDKDLRPEAGFRDPYASRRNEVRMLCVMHWQVAWAAFHLCHFPEADFRLYDGVIIQIASYTKPCEGLACSNTDPPFYRARPSASCGDHLLNGKAQLCNPQGGPTCKPCANRYPDLLSTKGIFDAYIGVTAKFQHKELAVRAAAVAASSDPTKDNGQDVQDKFIALGGEFAPPAVIALNVMADCINFEGRGRYLTRAIARLRTQRTLNWLFELEAVPDPLEAY
ncbi:uncharacterized protein LOC62_01G001506 [Vanrija pseudolonga]|uniref:Uncharacterized protein n=1 Tax=Vanrija pseudolonga TaxID=143232 RepID=A0AAF1BND1_9TREE|nr:hypothetical protein LOC62_01G001506 [Vanrija pseudolonga]